MPGEIEIPQRRLAEVATEDLVEELKARSTAIVLLALDQSGDDDERFRVMWNGGYYACLGMAQCFVRDQLWDGDGD